MSQGSQGRLQCQIDDIRKGNEKARGMPFADILKTERVAQAVWNAGVHVRNCVYTPVVTFHAFLAQVFSSDPSCRQAVCLLLAWLGISAKEKTDGSIETGAYCKARAKLPEELAAGLARAWAGI